MLRLASQSAIKNTDTKKKNKSGDNFEWNLSICSKFERAQLYDFVEVLDVLSL